MSFSDYMEGALLRHIFGKAVFTPINLYVALWDWNPTDTGAGGEEVSGGSYTRVLAPPSQWRTADLGIMSNLNNITFPQATADWGTVRYFALFDAPSGGNMLVRGALSPTRDVVEGSIPKFLGGDPPGGLIVVLDGKFPQWLEPGYGFSNYLENKTLDHVFGKGVYTPPTIYVALWKGSPGETGVQLPPRVEVLGGDYARVLTDDSFWSNPYLEQDILVITNDKPIAFPSATGDWGTVDYVALYDQSNNMLMYGPLSEPVTIIEGDVPMFRAQQMFFGLI